MQVERRLEAGQSFDGILETSLEENFGIQGEGIVINGQIFGLPGSTR